MKLNKQGLQHISIMQKKRLLLQADTNIKDLCNEEQCDRSSRCEGGFYHAASVIGSNDSYLNKELSYGINICHPTFSGIHAEAHAIMNLRSLPRKKHLKKIDILVIRTSINAKLGMSKPCIKCLLDMSILPQKKGYIIKNIFYSDKDGNIINTTLRNLINSDDYYVSRFYRERNFKIK